MADWREITGTQNLRMAAKLLEQQAEINALKAQNKELENRLIRSEHGHEPGEGQCEIYRCASCRYCGRERPCGCSLGTPIPREETPS